MYLILYFSLVLDWPADFIPYEKELLSLSEKGQIDLEAGKKMHQDSEERQHSGMSLISVAPLNEGKWKIRTTW